MWHKQGIVLPKTVVASSGSLQGCVVLRFAEVVKLGLGSPSWWNQSWFATLFSVLGGPTKFGK